jgi:DNA repair protein RecN (Recombination protein N)
MLEEVRITGLGVIDDAVLELSPGFNVVTGETGAGKTMVVSGLGLLFGGRADPARVRPGAERANVEGRLSVDADGTVARQVNEAGGDLDDDGGTLILSRSVSAEGRSRAHAGGRSVPVSLLTYLADDLVAVHGQADQQQLLKPGRQREALDRFAGADLAMLLAAYQQAYQRHREVRSELDELTTRARERQREAEDLRLGLAEVEQVEPVEGEDIELLTEEQRLAHADALHTAATSAHEVLIGDPSSGRYDTADAVTLLGIARQALEAASHHDAALAALGTRVSEAAYLVSDVAADLASYAQSVEADPVRLAAVQERRAELGRLIRKFGEAVGGLPGGEPPGPGQVAGEAGTAASAGTEDAGVAPETAETASPDGTPSSGAKTTAQAVGVAAVLLWAKRASARLLELEGDDDRIAGLAEQEAALAAAAEQLSGQLTAARKDAAEHFAVDVTAELAALAMPHARVTVAVTPLREPGLYGADDIEIRLAAHPGAPALPLHKGASGGELSRVMLAIEVVFAGADPVPTFVFDEVDAGVGGKAAVEVGRRLARLASRAQVIVVTHLPQVAAFADTHLMVERADDGSVTRSGVARLDAGGRVRELSRMLAGLEDSEFGRAHAEELLAAATAERKGRPAASADPRTPGRHERPAGTGGDDPNASGLRLG